MSTSSQPPTELLVARSGAPNRCWPRMRTLVLKKGAEQPNDVISSPKLSGCRLQMCCACLELGANGDI